MKKLIVFLFVILVSLPIEAQFALKGGISYAKDELSSYVVTGQFYQDLLVVSGDVFIPTEKTDEISGAGRIGIGFGGYRIRFAADIGAVYEKKNFRFAYGTELNPSESHSYCRYRHHHSNHQVPYERKNPFFHQKEYHQCSLLRIY